jgi:hypothetical protein
MENYDFRISRAKQQIADALGLRQPQPVPQPTPQPAPQQMPMSQGQPPRLQANVMPQGVGVNAQVPVGNGQVDLNAQTRGANLQQLQAQYTNPNFSAGVGYNPQQQGVMANVRVPFAKGGGVWTRKEGQNPEGGLNAAGRASLKAQGHDIKPPVSAKQAKKSPKAAGRRKSFCARMSGMPGPMKDDNGKPTRKALSLRKWDC